MAGNKTGRGGDEGGRKDREMIRTFSYFQGGLKAFAEHMHTVTRTISNPVSEDGAAASTTTATATASSSRRVGPAAFEHSDSLRRLAAANSNSIRETNVDMPMNGGGNNRVAPLSVSPTPPRSPLSSSNSTTFTTHAQVRGREKIEREGREGEGREGWMMLRGRDRQGKTRMWLGEKESVERGECWKRGRDQASFNVIRRGIKV